MPLTFAGKFLEAWQRSSLSQIEGVSANKIDSYLLHNSEGRLCGKQQFTNGSLCVVIITLFREVFSWHLIIPEPANYRQRNSLSEP
jgi:hypothetical protein